MVRGGIANIFFAVALFGCGGRQLDARFLVTDGGSVPIESGTPAEVQAPPIVLDSGFVVDGSTPTKEVAEIYAHSATKLFRIDPDTYNVTEIGVFSNCGTNDQMVDIALDENSQMFGTTFYGVNRIDKTTATCTPLRAGPSYPNSLSFVPKGTVDPNNEALVGYFGSTYSRIDTQTGAITTLGVLGGGYISSGDIVSVKGGGTYLTVKGLGCADCLVEVNPSTGALVKKLGSVARTDVFGLAFWGGRVFGFSDGGDLFEINPSTMMTTQVPLPSSLGSLSFWGAGSTTSAPVKPPQ